MNNTNDNNTNDNNTNDNINGANNINSTNKHIKIDARKMAINILKKYGEINNDTIAKYILETRHIDRIYQSVQINLIPQFIARNMLNKLEKIMQFLKYIKYYDQHGLIKNYSRKDPSKSDAHPKFITRYAAYRREPLAKMYNLIGIHGKNSAGLGWNRNSHFINATARNIIRKRGLKNNNTTRKNIVQALKRGVRFNENGNPITGIEESKNND